MLQIVYFIFFLRILHIATAKNKVAVVAGILRTEAKKELINAQNHNCEVSSIHYK